MTIVVTGTLRVNCGFSLLDVDAPGLPIHTRKLKRIHSSEFWLEDDHINQAMSVLKKVRPYINGFEDVCVIETGRIAKKMENPWIQVLNCEGNHWLTATTIDCDNGVVRIYDSLYRRIPKSLLQLIVKLTSWPSSLPLIIEMPCFQKQLNNSDCGLFAIAAMVTLFCGKDPSEASYDLNYMRAHLVDCLKKGRFVEFPYFLGRVQKLGAVCLNYNLCTVCSSIILNDSESVICASCHQYCHAASCTQLFGQSVLCVKCFS